MNLETPFRSIRFLLVADVLADLIEVEPDRGDGITPGPEMLAREILLSPTQPGNSDATLPFQESDDRSDRVLGGNGHADVHRSGFKCPSMIWHSFCRAKAWT